MKHLALLFAATAAALAAPSPDRPQQIAIIEKQQAAQDAVQTWWNAFPSPGSLFSTIETRITRSIQRTINGGLDFDTDDDGDENDPDHHHPPHHRPPRRGHNHPGDKTKTIYELIKDSKYTTKFAKLVEEHDEIKSLLSDTKHNHTLFVPTDKAFERIPHHKDPPSKEFILALLKYHALPGLYTAGRVVHSHTLPTELSPGSLGNHPQRLRVSLGFLFTLHLNFFSKVVAGNIEAKNGVIHAVDGILVPPPSQAKIISLLPGAFSTFSLGLETTGLAEELKKSDEVGGTLFAPTNRAFEKLGPGANAFLFSERGKKYLKAILKYHVVLGQTLYSDAFYKKKNDNGDGDGDGDDGDDDKTEGDRDYWHVDLPSQLDDKPIAVDVKRWKGFISIVLNGFTRVALQDGVASDGVIQVIGSVLIPPHKHRSGDGADSGAEQRDGEISVEELKSRLGPYVEGQVGSGMHDL